MWQNGKLLFYANGVGDKTPSVLCSIYTHTQHYIYMYIQIEVRGFDIQSVYIADGWMDKMGQWWGGWYTSGERKENNIVYVSV